MIQRTIVAWQKVEPAKGRYDFSQLDSVAEAAGEAGIDTVVTIRALSEWGSSRDIVEGYQETWEQQQRRPRGKRSRAVAARSSYPQDVEAWLQMLRRMVERYDGDGEEDMPNLRCPIRYWQIENEISWQWVGPMSSYVELLRKSRQAIRQADPQAKIVLGAITASQYFALDAGLIEDPTIRITTPNRQREVSVEEVRNNPQFQEKKEAMEVLFAQAGPYFDIADMHSYSDDAQYLSVQAKWMRFIMEKNGYQRPIWCLECGGPMSDYSPTRHAEEVIKRVTVAFANGISAVFWSTLMPTTEFPQKYINLSLVDESGNTKPAFNAYQLMARIVREADQVTVLDTPPGVRAYEFSRADGKRFWIGWATGGRQSLTVRTHGVRRVRIFKPPYLQEGAKETVVHTEEEAITLATYPVVVESLD
jgi:hypothetical protein